MRRTLAKLRIGCHNLRFETGRYDKCLSMNRYVLSVVVIEDETHLSLDLDCQPGNTYSFPKLKEKLMIFKTYCTKIWYHN